MTGRFIKLLSVASTLVLFHFNANAAFISFTSEMAFLTATDNAVTDSYNDLTSYFDDGVTLASPFSRTLSGGSYDLRTADNSRFFVGANSFASSGQEYISNNTETGKAISVLNFGALPSGAIGGFFFGSSQTPVSAMVSATAFDIQGDSTSLSTDCDLTAAACFIGFSSTVAIDRLEFTSDSSYVGLDDLTFANQATANPVPAPASLSLLGLALLAFRLHRK